MADNFLSQWIALEGESTFTSPKELTMKATTFERTVRNRNLREFAAGALGIALYFWLAWDASQAGAMLKAAGWIVSLAGMVLVMAHLYYRGSNLPRRPEHDCHSHLRSQIVHQRDALRTVDRWYLGPLIPGLVIVFLANAWDKAAAGSWLTAIGVAVLQFTLVAMVFGFVLWLNRRAAGRLEAELAELDAVNIV